MQLNHDESEQVLNSMTVLCNIVGKYNQRWWQDLITGEAKDRNIGELLMLVTSELAEALEGDRKNLKDDKLPQYKMFDVEIADALIRLFDIGFHLCPSLPIIFLDKIKFNLNREDHKPENRVKVGGKKY